MLYILQLYQDLGAYKCIYVLFFYVLNKVSLKL